MKKRRTATKRATNPIEAEAGRADRIFFQEPMLKNTAGLGFNAARFIPIEVKAILEKRQLWQDAVQALYAAIIEWWRTNPYGRNFRPAEDKEHYKAFVRYIWRELYKFFRANIPEYKRKVFEKFVDPSELRGVAVEDSESGVAECGFTQEQLALAGQWKGITNASTKIKNHFLREHPDGKCHCRCGHQAMPVAREQDLLPVESE